MDSIEQDTLFFFGSHMAAYPLYRAFSSRLLAEWPDTQAKVQKTQITFSNRHVFACVSFLRVKKKAELPDGWFVLTLGLPSPPESQRVAAKTEPYPGRWTTHFVISDPSELDDTLFDWVGQAYDFSERK